MLGDDELKVTALSCGIWNKEKKKRKKKKEKNGAAWFSRFFSDSSFFLCHNMTETCSHDCCWWWLKASFSCSFFFAFKLAFYEIVAQVDFEVEVCKKTIESKVIHPRMLEDAMSYYQSVLKVTAVKVLTLTQLFTQIFSGNLNLTVNFLTQKYEKYLVRRENYHQVNIFTAVTLRANYL